MSVESIYIMIPFKSRLNLEQLHYVHTHVCFRGSERQRKKVKKKKGKGDRREWNKEAGQLERQERVSAPASGSSIFNDASVPSSYSTLLLPHLLSTLATLKHTQAQPVVIQFLCFRCLLFISWIPCEASKAAVSVRPLTVLCICHSGLVKR